MSYKFKLSFLIIMAACLNCSAQAEAVKKMPFSRHFDKQCFVGVPDVDNREFDSRTTPVDILSDEANTSDQDHVSFKGNVKITQGNRVLKSDYSQFNRINQKFNAYGNIDYQDGYISIRDASEVETSVNKKILKVSNPKYQLHSSPARGDAKQADYDQLEKTYHLENATFTTCAENSETWKLKASTVDVDEDEVFGEAWNASLWLYDIPVFYFPYINFPIRNERKTGFLYPLVGYGHRNGFEFIAPFYWNIAPNYDYTLTPTWRGHRGLHLKNEFRYMLTPTDAGNIIYEYTANDKYAEKFNYIDGHRWYKHWDHRSSFLQGTLNVGINYNKVKEKDYNYFNDYSNTAGSTDKVVQSFGATYQPFKFTTFGLNALNYQMLIDTAVKPFEMLPQFTVKNFVPLPWFSLYNTFEYANFGHSDENKQAGNYEGKRYHLQSKVQIPIIQQPFFQLDSNVRFMFTHYEQEMEGGSLLWYYTSRGFDKIDPTVNRFVPTFQIQARLIMDNDFSIFGHSFSQSLEPIIQYYYAPYRNQDRIGLYDTTNIIQDYFYIFDDNRYAGVDRISDDNRLSLGFVSKISDELGVERAIFSLGMAYYLKEGQVKLYPNYKDNNRHRSYLNGSLDLKPTNSILYNGSFIYNTEDHYLYRASSVLEYNNDDLLAQINYRYTKDGNRTMFKNEIIDMKQLGFLTRYAFSNRLSVVLGYYHDLEQKHAIDKIVKLRYEDCCWRFSVYAEQVNEPDNKRQVSEKDNKFGLQFEMKGLATLGAKDISDNLDTRLLPYSRPFNLSEN